MATPETPHGFNLTKKDGLNTLYIGNDGAEQNFIILLDNPDSFSVEWKTSFTIDEFLTHACAMADKIKTLRPGCRPMDTGNPISVTSLDACEVNDENTGINNLTVDSSYSGFDYNNVYIGTKVGSAEIVFEPADWPLTRQALQKAMYGNPSAINDIFEIVNDSFIRINTEFCTIMIGGRTPKTFTVWSHVPAIDIIAQSYRETALKPCLETELRDTLNILTSPRFAQFLQG